MVDVVVNDMHFLLLGRKNLSGRSRRCDHDNLLSAICGESSTLHLVRFTDLIGTLDSIVGDLGVNGGLSDDSRGRSDFGLGRVVDSFLQDCFRLSLGLRFLVSLLHGSRLRFHDLNGVGFGFALRTRLLRSGHLLDLCESFCNLLFSS